MKTYRPYELSEMVDGWFSTIDNPADADIDAELDAFIASDPDTRESLEEYRDDIRKLMVEYVLNA